MIPVAKRITLVDLIKRDGPLLDFARAAILAPALREGVDILRTRPNEITFLGGQIQTHQIWQSVRFTLHPPSSVRVTLSVDDVVTSFRQGGQRLDRIRYVKPGSVVRALVRDPEASELTLANLEIYGWEVATAMLPEVEEALRLLGAS